VNETQSIDAWKNRKLQQTFKAEELREGKATGLPPGMKLPGGMFGPGGPDS
jgi:hypothetical protein